MTNTFLLNDFYTISQLNAVDDKLSAIITLNPNHAIFKGHFEQMPIVPGVCQTQIIKEIMQQHFSKNLTLSKGDNIKFTAMIIPTQHPNFNIEIKYQLKSETNYSVDATLFLNDTTFTKFKGTFTS